MKVIKKNLDLMSQYEQKLNEEEKKKVVAGNVSHCLAYCSEGGLNKLHMFGTFATAGGTCVWV